MTRASLNRSAVALRVCSSVLAFLLISRALASEPPAAELFQLDAFVYVFNNAELTDHHAPRAQGSQASDVIQFQSPATLQFREQALSLKGSAFSWSSGRNPPAGFTLLQLPHIVTASGKSVEMFSTAPFQYLQKKPDGTLQVVNIDKNSAEAPHCRITFAVKRVPEAKGDLAVECTIDLATVAARDKVSGVDLDVGPPILAQFHDHARMTAPLGEWQAVLLRAPNGNDHSMLLLVKTDVDKPSVAQNASNPMRSVRDLARFFTDYYLHPQPELISRAIEALTPTNFFNPGGTVWENENAYISVGFFSEVFAANPDRLAEWQAVIRRQGGDTPFWLRKAIDLSRRGGALTLDQNRPYDLTEYDENRILWGAFTASGNTTYITKLIDKVPLVDEAIRPLFNAGAEAMVLLAYNEPAHERVRETLVPARERAHGRTRELIDDLLTKKFEAILDELSVLDHEPERVGEREFPWRRHRH